MIAFRNYLNRFGIDYYLFYLVVISIINSLLMLFFIPKLFLKYHLISKEYYFFYLTMFSIFNVDLGFSKFFYSNKSISYSVLFLYLFLCFILYGFAYLISGVVNHKILFLLPLMAILHLSNLVKVVFDTNGYILTGIITKLFRIMIFIGLFYFIPVQFFNLSAWSYVLISIFILILLIRKMPAIIFVSNKKLNYLGYITFFQISIVQVVANIFDKILILGLIENKSMPQFVYLNDSSNYILFLSNLFFSYAFFRSTISVTKAKLALFKLGILSIIVYEIISVLFLHKNYGIYLDRDYSLIVISILLFITYVINSLHWFNLYRFTRVLPSTKYLYLALFPTIIYYLLIGMFYYTGINSVLIFVVPQIVRLALEYILFNNIVILRWLRIRI